MDLLKIELFSDNLLQIRPSYIKPLKQIFYFKLEFVFYIRNVCFYKGRDYRDFILSLQNQLYNMF